MPTSPIAKRSITIGGHKTSVSLEHDFWNALKLIAVARGQTVSQLIAAVDDAREHGNLSSALRVLVIMHYREAARGGASSKPSTGGPPAPATPDLGSAGAVSAPAGEI
jgi:predicted DNA-binding ribbon-helix-helix protein